MLAMTCLGEALKNIKNRKAKTSTPPEAGRSLGLGIIYYHYKITDYNIKFYDC
jgi:hypothetical protein